MIADQHKWWRWIGEESLSGGTLGLHEGGGMFPCGQRRPSEHSIMRWLGFDWDQVGREHMVARITGPQERRADVRCAARPEGPVAQDGVLWVEAQHPKFHELDVTWRIGGPNGAVLDTADSAASTSVRSTLAPGTSSMWRCATRSAPTAWTGYATPRPATAATDSGYNGPRFVQARQWTVGDTTVAPSPPAAEITLSSMTGQPVGGDEVVFVETNHPTDRVLDVALAVWTARLPQPANSRNLDLGALGLPWEPTRSRRP